MACYLCHQKTRELEELVLLKGERGDLHLAHADCLDQWKEEERGVGK